VASPRTIGEEPGDWILAIDCDEVFHGQARLPVLLDQAAYDVLAVTLFNMWERDPGAGRRALAPFVPLSALSVLSRRRVRRSEAGVWLSPKLRPSRDRGGEVAFRHRPCSSNTFGYASMGDKLSKHRRYMEIDGAGIIRSRKLRSILDPNPTLADWNGATFDSNRYENATASDSALPRTSLTP